MKGLAIPITIGVIGVIIILLVVVKIEVPCVGCETGGLFYRCKKGTGKCADGGTSCSEVNESEGCKRYKRGEKLVTDLIDDYQELSAQVQRFPDAVKEPIQKAEEQLKNLIPKFDFVRKAMEEIEHIKLPTNINFSCSIGHIPKWLSSVIGVSGEVDPCGNLASVLESAFGVINKLIAEALNGVKKGLQVIEDAINDKVIQPIKTTLIENIKKALEPFDSVKEEVREIKEDLEALTMKVREAYLDVIYFQVVKFIQGIFPVSPTIALMLAFLIIVVIPVLGGLYGAFSLVRDIVSVPALFVGG